MVTRCSKFQFWNNGNNRFLNKYIVNKFCYTFVHKFCWINIFVNSFLKCFNFKMKFGKIMELVCESLYTKPNLCLSAKKLLKLVYTPLNVSFLIKSVVNLFFSLQILSWRKEKELLFSVANENLYN